MLKSFIPVIKLLSPALLIVGNIFVSSVYLLVVYELNTRLTASSDKSAFILHIILSSGVIILLLWSFSLFATIFTRLRTRAVMNFFAIVLSLYLLLLSLFYPLSLTANFFWGDNITLNLLREHITQVPWLLEALPFNALTSYLILVLVICIYAALFFIYTKISNISLEALRSHLLLSWVKSMFMLLAGFLLLSGYIYITFNLFNSAWQSMVWKEPFTDLFMANDPFSPGVSPWRMRVAEQDRQERKKYLNSKTGNTPNIAIIVVDSLRPDHMGLYGYHRPTTPFLVRLYEGGLLKKTDMALATCPNSYCGILSIMTSKPFRDISYYNFKIYDLLRDLGYRVNFILSGFHRNWYNLSEAYGTEIDSFFDYGNTNLSITDDKIVIEGLNDIPKYKDTPSFFYFFLMSAHRLGVKKEEYNIYKPTRLTDDGEMAEVIINRYDNGVVQTDAYIQKIFTKLMESGYLKNSLIIITADHGENLGEDSLISPHGQNLYQHQIRIPLLIYDNTNQQQQYKDLSLARQIDIAPTVIDYLGLPVPDVWWGNSLLSHTPEKCSYHQSFRGKPSYAVVCRLNGKIYKYIVRSYNFYSDKTEELYEISNDPQEDNNLMVANNNELIDLFRNKFAEHWK